MKSSEEKSKKSDRKTYPLRLEKATLKALKQRAVDQETSIQKILDRLIDDYLSQAPGK